MQSDLVRVRDLETLHEYSIPRERLTIQPELFEELPDEPVNAPVKYHQPEQPKRKLTGDDLEQALLDRGLPSEGTADEKRAAVAAHDGSTQV